VNKNKPNYFRFGCKPFFNLKELIEVDAKLEKLEKFEETLETDEILRI